MLEQRKFWKFSRVTSQLKVMENLKRSWKKLWRSWNLKSSKGVRTLVKLTTPLYTHFSPVLPLTWLRPLCKENFMWLRFLLLRNVSLSPVLFAVILVLLWVPKCCNWNCKARRKVSIVFVMDQFISKKLSENSEASISLIKLSVNTAWLLHDNIRVACILEKSVGLAFIPWT